MPKVLHMVSHEGYVNHTTTEEVPCVDQPYKITVGTTALLKLVDWFQGAKTRQEVSHVRECQ